MGMALLWGSVVGIVGGALGTCWGQTVYGMLAPHDINTGDGSPVSFFQRLFARAIGYSIVGAIVGAAQGASRRSWVIARQGAFGGFVGGGLGGIVFQVTAILMNTAVIARLAALVATGALVGFFVGLVQNLFKQAWIRVVLGAQRGQGVSAGEARDDHRAQRTVRHRPLRRPVHRADPRRHRGPAGPKAAPAAPRRRPAGAGARRPVPADDGKRAARDGGAVAGRRRHAPDRQADASLSRKRRRAARQPRQPPPLLSLPAPHYWGGGSDSVSTSLHRPGTHWRQGRNILRPYEHLLRPSLPSYPFRLPQTWGRGGDPAASAHALSARWGRMPGSRSPSATPR